MSYSFTVRGADKAEAKAKVADELDKVARTQPIHEQDRTHVQTAANAFIDLLGDEPDKDVVVSMHGSVSHWPSTAPGLTAASVGVNAQLDTRKPDQA